MLSILTHYYERLQNEYGGELKNVRSPTIEAETDIFRISQDSLFRWILSIKLILLNERSNNIPNINRSIPKIINSFLYVPVSLNLLDTCVI